MKSRVVKRSILVVIIMSFSISAKESEKWPEKVLQPKEGNFALPLSQQPPPLISFGQNFLDGGEFLAWIYPIQLKGKQKSEVEIIPSFLYGITSKLSVFVELPIVVKSKHGNTIHRDFSDMLLQLEQIVYVSETTRTSNVISVVANMTFPTGLAVQEPSIEFGPPSLESSIGLGSPSFFLGTTLSRSHPDWYYFSSLGGQITTYHKRNKPGNSFLYQFGVGKNIAYKTEKWILNWLVELDGAYSQRDIASGVTDCNSGGNIVILGPSLFFSTQQFISQAGILAVIAQHLFGEQHKNNYVAAVYVGWKF